MFNKIFNVFFARKEQSKKTIIRKNNCLRQDNFNLINKKIVFKSFEEREQYYKMLLIPENQR